MHNKSNLRISDPTKRHLCSHTNSETRIWVQSVQTNPYINSIHKHPQTHVPKQISKSVISIRFFSGTLFAHKSNLRISDPTKRHLCSHTNSETRLWGPECPNESLHQLHPQTYQTQSTKGSSNSRTFLRPLFRDINLIQLSASKSIQKFITFFQHNSLTSFYCKEFRVLQRFIEVLEVWSLWNFMKLYELIDVCRHF